MLRKKVNPNGFCGGSLITDQWVRYVIYPKKIKTLLKTDKKNCGCLNLDSFNFIEKMNLNVI